MKLTDEQICSIMQKHIICKSLLVFPNEEDEVVVSHTQDGWELANKTKCGEKIKLTFRKVEKV